MASIPFERFCTGGPSSGKWCGSPAELVCTDTRGLKWYACAEHTEGAQTEPLAAFVARFDSAGELEAALTVEQEKVRRFVLRGRATQAAVDQALAAQGRVLDAQAVEMAAGEALGHAKHCALARPHTKRCLATLAVEGCNCEACAELRLMNAAGRVEVMHCTECGRHVVLDGHAEACALVAGGFRRSPARKTPLAGDPRQMEIPGAQKPRQGS